MVNLEIYKKHDFDLEADERVALLNLLSKAFTGYFKEQIFVKQVPTYRFIVKEKGAIIAQTGIDCRVVNTSKLGVLKTYGVIDMCVAPTFQGHGIASQLLSHIANEAIERTVDFIFLFADDHRVYERNGYKRVNATCRLLAIENLSCIKVIEKDMSDSLMVLPIHNSFTLDGDFVDMLGYLY